MDPLRKDERFEDKKFERKFKDEKLKEAEISRPAEFEEEEPIEACAEPETRDPTSVPMGPMTTKGEAREPKAGGPRLVSKESKAAAEAREKCFFSEREMKEMRARWDQIQGAFVDQPRQAVEDADNLLGEAIKKLTEQYSEERSTVIRQWNSGDNVSTEVLRQALRRYRTFFDRLLAA